MIDKISKKRVHRCQAANNLVGIIAIDAIPEILWSGTVRELKSTEPGYWKSRFNGRRDYSRCTDLVAAFSLAAEFLSGDPRYVQKTLYVWSDLVSEASGSSVYRSKTYSRLPPRDFPWHTLRSTDITVFMVEPDQKLAWLRAADRHGLANFTIYTPSESAAVDVQLPAAPEFTLTDTEHEALRSRYIGYAWGIALAVLGLFVLVVLLPLAIMIIRRRTPGNDSNQVSSVGNHGSVRESRKIKRKKREQKGHSPDNTRQEPCHFPAEKDCGPVQLAAIHFHRSLQEKV